MPACDALWMPIGANPELTVMMASTCAAVDNTLSARAGA
jgi:hypothetical protein